MKDFSGDGLVGNLGSVSYAIGEKQKQRLPIFAYVILILMALMIVWSISIVFGFRPAISLADHIVETVVAGLK